MHEETPAQENAAGWAETIAELAAALECDFDRLEELRDMDERDADEQAELSDLEEQAGEFSDRDEVEQRIQESPLEVTIRSGWYTPGDEPEQEEFRILLTFGGPALQIRGELNEYNEPSRAWLEYQDWGTPWTEYHGEGCSKDALLSFSRCFYFGE